MASKPSDHQADCPCRACLSKRGKQAAERVHLSLSRELSSWLSQACKESGLTRQEVIIAVMKDYMKE